MRKQKPVEIPERVTLALLRSGQTGLAAQFGNTGMCAPASFLDKVELALMRRSDEVPGLEHLRALARDFAMYRDHLGLGPVSESFADAVEKSAWKELAEAAKRTGVTIRRIP